MEIPNYGERSETEELVASPLEMSGTGKAPVLGFKYLELQTGHWRARDCKPMSFGVQQLLSLTPPPPVLQ